MLVGELYVVYYEIGCSLLSCYFYASIVFVSHHILSIPVLCSMCCYVQCSNITESGFSNF